jgi:hypothetical protein
MKRLVLTIAVVLGLSMTTFAQGGGLFQRGANNEESHGLMNRDPKVPGLPGHGSNENEDAPMGSGIAVLIGLGAAYALTKNRKEK